MSHVVSIATEIRDLEAVKAACKRLGWTFRAGQTEYKWAGYWADDSPVPRHLFSQEEYDRICAMSSAERRAFMPTMLGRCSHAISVPGCSFEIGLIEQKQPGRKVQYQPVWDWWQVGGLQAVLGNEGGCFVQAYAVEKAKLEARRKGLQCQEHVLHDGSVKLTIKAGY